MATQDIVTNHDGRPNVVEEKQGGALLRYLYGVTQFGAGTWKSYFSSYIAMLYTDVYVLPVALSGALELLTQFLDWFAGPIFGTIVDRVTFRRGKYWQWITIGSLATTAIYIVIFGLPVLFQNPERLAFVVFLLAAIRSLSVPMCDVTLAALYPRIADSPKDRSFLAMAKSVGLRLGQIVGGYVTPVLLIFFTAKLGSEPGGWASTAVVLGIAGLACYLLFAFTLRGSHVETAAIREKDLATRKKARVPFIKVLEGLVTNRAMLTIFAFMVIHKLYYFFQAYASTYFFKYCINDLAALGICTTFRTAAQVAGVVLGVVWLKLLRDSKRAFLAAGVFHILTLGWSVLVVRSNSAMSFILVSSASYFFAGLMEAYILPFFAAASDYGTLKTGVKAEGLNMSIYPLSLTLASASSIALRSGALNAVGYNPKLYVGGVTPPQEVLKVFTNLQTLYPFVLSIVAVALVALFYPIDDNKLRQIKAELKEREELTGHTK